MKSFALFSHLKGRCWVVPKKFDKVNLILVFSYVLKFPLLYVCPTCKKKCLLKVLHAIVFVFCLFSSSILNLYLHQKIIWFKPSLVISYEKEKKDERKREKEIKGRSRNLEKEVWGLLCMLSSVDSKVIRVNMLLWTKHRDMHSWNHAGLMERLAWTPSPGTRGSCWVLWKTGEAKPSRFLYNSYTLPLLCFILWRDSPKDIGPVIFKDPFKKRKKTGVEKENV